MYISKTLTGNTLLHNQYCYFKSILIMGNTKVLLNALCLVVDEYRSFTV